MHLKNLNTEVIIRDAGINKNQNFDVYYYIIKDENDMYGVEIQKKFLNSTYSECAVIMVSHKKEDALDLMNKLARCKVTPLSVDYIIEDLSI